MPYFSVGGVPVALCWMRTGSPSGARKAWRNHIKLQLSWGGRWGVVLLRGRCAGHPIASSIGRRRDGNIASGAGVGRAVGRGSLARMRLRPCARAAGCTGSHRTSVAVATAGGGLGEVERCRAFVRARSTAIEVNYTWVLYGAYSAYAQILSRVFPIRVSCWPAVAILTQGMPLVQVAVAPDALSFRVILGGRRNPKCMG